MAVYTLGDVSTLYADLKALATADTNLTIEYDDGVDDMVWYHTGLGIYIELDDIDSKGVSIWVGKTWTSGETLTDRYQVAKYYTYGATLIGGKCVVSADLFAISQYGSASHLYSIAIFEFNSDVICIGGCGTDDKTIANSYNITDAATINPVYLQPIANLSLGGNYATIPLYLADLTGVITDVGGLPLAASNFKILLRAANTASPIENIGTDLVLNCAKTGGGLDVSKACIIGEGLYQ